jgi:hypothetical protein
MCKALPHLILRPHASTLQGSSHNNLYQYIINPIFKLSLNQCNVGPSVERPGSSPVLVKVFPLSTFLIRNTCDRARSPLAGALKGARCGKVLFFALLFGLNLFPLLHCFLECRAEERRR